MKTKIKSALVCLCISIAFLVTGCAEKDSEASYEVETVEIPQESEDNSIEEPESVENKKEEARKLVVMDKVLKSRLGVLKYCKTK